MSISPKSIVCVNGRYVPAAKASISALDRGFLLGDGLFETLHVLGRKPVFWAKHLARLKGSARSIGIPMPCNGKSLFRILSQLIAKNRITDGVARITVSRGKYTSGLAFDPKSKPTLVVIAYPFKGHAASIYRDGVKVVVSAKRANACSAGVKSINYLNNILAKAEADSKKAHEALVVSPEGIVLECTTANIFFVRRGVLKTPALSCGILPGVVRGVVLDLARKQGLKVMEGRFSLRQIRQADEIFITSSVRGVAPVTQLDSRKISSGKPGPACRKLMETYQALLARNR